MAHVENKEYYRPEWTCGRYNEIKKVAIMYNLIAGFSFFFDEESAIVIGHILQVKRNGKIDIYTISEQTGIALESVCDFMELLSQHGLVTNEIVFAEGIEHYRKQVVAFRQQQGAWSDNDAKEKLPMATTNAEQLYFTAVDDGKTICSCMFELTYRCSEMCIHCYNPGATRDDQEISHREDFSELSLDDYKRIIDEMYEMGLVKVCLSGGDPFSKEFVWEIIEYLYEKEIAFDVFTNGQRLLNNVQRLADYYPRLVGVSVYSGVAEDHDKITRIPGSWNRSIKIVEQLSSLAVPLNLKCCVMQPNLHTYYMVADLAKKYRAIPQFEINITESNDGDLCAKQLRLTEEQLQIVLRDDNIPLYVGPEAPNFGGQKRDLNQCSCGAGETGFCLTPDGNLRACVAFSLNLGNLKKQTAYEILTGSLELKCWRNSVVGDYTECGRYDYCDYCNLCAGVNYTEHGDFRKPAETNCYMAKCRYNLAQKLMKNPNQPMTREQLIDALQKLPIKETILQRKF